MTGAALLEAAKGEPPVDIVFLDIDMPEKSSVNIVGELRKIPQRPGTAFVTAI